jgi:hypothetical protein
MAVGPRMAGVATVNMYVDDMVNPAFTHSETVGGFNGMEITASGSSVTGWYDELVFQEGAYAPAISGLANATNNPGDTVTFTATAVGSPCNIRYYWQKNGVPLTDGGNISGSATTTLTISGVSGSDAAAYSLVASNIAGVTTASANLVLNQTITFANPGDQTYGTPLALSALGATASSGLTVTYSVASGPATISGGNVIFTGVGAVTLQADQAGNAVFTPAASVQQTFAVNPAALTPVITVSSKPYDGTSAATITGWSLTGVVGNDDVNLGTSGTAAFVDPNVGVGKTVNVTGLSLFGNTAANYTCPSTATATADITGAGTITALVSSQNPSAVTSNVTFTATVSSGVGTPAGTVVFLANAVPFSTNGLVSGAASASTASLPAGTNTIAAQFAAQGNYLGSSDSLSEVVTNSVIYSQTSTILSIVNNGDGTYTLNFQGTEGASYYVVASADATVPMTRWAVVGTTNTAGAGGLWFATVSNAAPAFYRAAALNPAP